MILIFSNSAHEPTTDAVVDWLIKYNAPFVRLNSEDVVQKEKEIMIDPANKTIRIAAQDIPFDTINVIWYRRWYSYQNIPIYPTSRHQVKLLGELWSEADSILNFLGFALAEKKWLNNPFSNQLHNKLNALYQAKLLGLNTPDSLITNKRSSLLDFYEKCCKQVITKPLSDPTPFFDEKGNNYKAYVEPLEESLLNKLPPDFFLSYFQNKIAAAFEIRVFYLDGTFYATAILNNTNTDIKLSVRKDDKVRMTAYKLPRDLEDKLSELMNKLHLNSGSMDIIKTVDNEYVFLEVNPVGQFTGYGFPNNYYLEKRVAEWLIENNHP